MSETDNIKSIVISGTGTKYEMKKVLKEKKEPKLRVDSEKWNLSEEDLSHGKQMEGLVSIQHNNNSNSNSNNSNNSKYEQLIVSQIKHKLSSYKQQDILKKILSSEMFITFDKVIDLLVSSNLKCHYCDELMNVLYEVVRLNKQWSLDRIDNNQGHNDGNLVVACLGCNLKRRRVDKDAFYMTKNLKIIREGIDN
jgi:hypothetical protein